jgi:hypothetical protein
MTLSAAEIDLIIKEAGDSGESSPRSRRVAEMRRLLRALPNFEFQSARATALRKLCAAGTQYGWRELEKNAPTQLLARLSDRAKASVRRNLQRDLEWITRPSFTLEWKSFGLAIASMGLTTGKPDQMAIERMFLRDRPSHRLFSLFKKFPVLARLWSQSIEQWRAHVKEVLFRFAQDRWALSHTFFSNRPILQIRDAHFGLSDRHHAGRTVVRLQFESDSIIYKPRSGRGELEWFSLLRWMNEHGFRPKLRAARVLPRKGYCWMENVESASLLNEAAARRFYQRMGGIIAAAHLLRAVDCHRDNFIASGEHPVLVDADALWHVPPRTKTARASDLLHRTGFFPNANPLSLQSRSSILGPGMGTHLPRVGSRSLAAAHYQREMILGFARAWHCLVGTTKAREAFARRLKRIRSTERRWIYRATDTYAAILDASIQPPALRSGWDRDIVIRARCPPDSSGSRVAGAEVRALKQLDIPYLTTETDQRLPPDQPTAPSELIEALGAVLPDPV